MNTNFERLSKSIWVKITVAVIAFFVFYLVAGFLFPVFLSIALAFVLFPLVKWIEKLSVGGSDGVTKSIAIVIAFIIAGLFMYTVVAFLVLPLFKELNNLLVNSPGLTNMGTDDLSYLLDPVTRAELPSTLLSLIDSALAMATNYVMSFTKNLVNSTFDIATSLVSLVIVPFLTFYFLKDWRTLRNMAIDVFSYESQPHVAKIIDEIGTVLSSYVRGMFEMCLIAGICITAGTTFLGVKYALVLGFIAVIVELVPVVGPILGSVPAIFIAYNQSPHLALKLAVFYLIYYQIDSQMIMPNLMGKAISLHPVLIIVGVLVGGKLFGISGLLFAVPMVAVCRVLYDNLWHMGEDKKISLK